MEALLFIIVLIVVVPPVIMFIISCFHDSKYSEENSLVIDAAVSYIEAGYRIVKNGGFDFPSVGLQMGDREGNGFKVAIYLTDDDFRLANIVQMREANNGWKISSDGQYLQKYSSLSYKGSWESFKNDVVKKIKELHPDWSFNSYSEIIVR